MGLLDRLFNKKEEKKPETTKSVVTEKPRSHFTGMKQTEYAAVTTKEHAAGRETGKPIRIGIYIDDVSLGETRAFDNLGKSDDVLAEDFRQMILVLQAQDAKNKGDTQRFNELKKRALHEKSLLQEPEFKALVLEAYTKAKATGFKYTDPGYQAVFNEVMVKAEEMQPNVAQRLSDAKEKLHKDEDKAPVATEPAVQKTEMSAEQIMAVTKDNYQK